MKKTFLIAASASLLFAACNKGDSNDPDKDAANAANTMLTTGQWTMVACEVIYIFDPPEQPVSHDIFANKKPYWKDDLFEFKTDHTMMIDEGPTKHLPADPQQRDGGGWALLNNGTQLSINDPIIGGSTITADIVALTSTTLELSYFKTIDFRKCNFKVKYTR